MMHDEYEYRALEVRVGQYSMASSLASWHEPEASSSPHPDHLALAQGREGHVAALAFGAHEAAHRKV